MGALDFIFDPKGKVAPTYEDLQQRRKIAAAMMARQGRMPKTFGEGLSAIGEAIGDVGYNARVERDAAANNEYAAKVLTGMPALGATPEPPPYNPNAGAPPPAAATAPAPSPVVSDQVPPPAPGNQAALPPPTGFKPPPAYLSAALEARIQDPNRRAYLGQLAGKEAKNPNEVSPTGAAGPFQFTRGTGTQYGLLGPQGDRRADVVASIDAASRLTDDNAKVLARGLGREPSPGELALAHQQGAGTAVRMLTGAGNAPSRNLAVNNAGGLGPQAAAQKIMAYYGMPGGPAGPAGPRDAAAAVLADRSGPAAPAAPDEQDALLSEVTGMGGPSAPPAANQTASLGRNDIQPDTPPVAAPAPPPVQMAQASGIPKAPAGPLAPSAVRPPLPTPNYLPTVTPEMQKLLRIANDPFMPPSVQKQAAATLQAEQDRIKTINDRLRHEYEPHQKIRLEEDAAARDPLKQAQLEKIKQEIANGKIIQLDGRLIRMDDGKPVDITPSAQGTVEGGPPQIKMTQDQSDTVKFYKMGKLAEEQLRGKEKILAEGWKQELAGAIPFAGNALLSSQYRAAKNAAGLLVQADLRDTSGATIGTKEYKDRFALLIPRWGDDDKQIEQKGAARRAVLEGQRLALGTARPMADYIDREVAKESAAKSSRIAEEMAGKERIVGKSYVNKKTGAVRVWTGDHWEEH